MTFINKLKKPKDMTDDELIEEFNIIQKIARQRGEHIPLPVTAREQVENDQTPPIHRAETEKQLQALRADFVKDPDMREALENKIPTSSKKGEEQQVVQNTAADLVKGTRRGVRGAQSMTGSAVPATTIAVGKRLEILNRYKEEGKQHSNFNDARDSVGIYIPGGKKLLERD